MREEASKDVVVICDNKQLRRAELINFLSDWCKKKDISVIGTDIHNILNLVSHNKCTLCILNLGGDFDHSRIGLKMQILSAIPSNPPVAVISDSEKMDLGHLVLHYGGSAFIPTTTQPNIVLSALSFVIEGGKYFPPEMVYCSSGPLLNVKQQDQEKLINSLVNNDATNENTQYLSESATSVSNESSISGVNVAQNLTFRQLDVLSYLSRGKSNKEIARSIGVSESTVKVHVRQVMKKLSVSNRTQAALAAAYQSDISYPSDVDYAAKPQPEYQGSNEGDAQKEGIATSAMHRGVIQRLSAHSVKSA